MIKINQWSRVKNIALIKFPFKSIGLPCCEDEPDSEKIALKWKSSRSIWIFWYLRYLFVLYANERYTKLYSNKLKCIHFTKYKTKDNHFLLINKQCIQVSKRRFSQSQAQMPIHSAKNHSIHRWWRHYVIFTSILDRRITPYLGDLCFRKYSSLRMTNLEMCLEYIFYMYKS